MPYKMKDFPWEGDQFITPTQVAQYLGITNRTLREWRSQDYGPTYIRFESGAIMYSFASVKRFANKRSRPDNDPLDLC